MEQVNAILAKIKDLFFAQSLHVRRFSNAIARSFWNAKVNDTYFSVASAYFI